MQTGIGELRFLDDRQFQTQNVIEALALHSFEPLLPVGVALRNAQVNIANQPGVWLVTFRRFACSSIDGLILCPWQPIERGF